jgi:5-bromo-4-chloroindolyl phosphate hydrolysis protein
MKQLLQKIKEFFNEPDQMVEMEERFYQKLNDMKKHPEKYQHLSKKSGWSKIPPVSLF